MIRLSTKGGVRLRAFARSFAVGLVMLAPLAASAAEAGGFTDRIIVKYRSTESSNAMTAAGAAAADAQVRGADMAAARLGVQLSRLHATVACRSPRPHSWRTTSRPAIRASNTPNPIACCTRC